MTVHEAESQLLRLLELVEEGEQVVIARNGKPIAELIRVRGLAGFPFDIARQTPIMPAGDEWWQPMTDTETEDWIEGR